METTMNKLGILAVVLLAACGAPGPADDDAGAPAPDHVLADLGDAGAGATPDAQPAVDMAQPPADTGTADAGQPPADTGPVCSGAGGACTSSDGDAPQSGCCPGLQCGAASGGAAGLCYARCQPSTSDPVAGTCPSEDVCSSLPRQPGWACLAPCTTTAADCPPTTACTPVRDSAGTPHLACYPSN